MNKAVDIDNNDISANARMTIPKKRKKNELEKLLDCNKYGIDKCEPRKRFQKRD